MDVVLNYYFILMIFVGAVIFMVALFVLFNIDNTSKEYGEKTVKHFLFGFWIFILPASLALSGKPDPAVLFWCATLSLLYAATHLEKLYKEHLSIKARTTYKAEETFNQTEEEEFAGHTSGADFDFDASVFGENVQADEKPERKRSASTSTEQLADPTPAPRGFENRHPDDAKLWAVVDDPSASDNERKNAFDMILKRKNRAPTNNGHAPKLLPPKGKRKG